MSCTNLSVGKTDIRDKEGREVDFVVTKDGEIELLVEAKLSDSQVSKHLSYYAERLKPKKAIQVVYNLKRSAQYGSLYVMNFFEFSESLRIIGQ